MLSYMTLCTGDLYTGGQSLPAALSVPVTVVQYPVYSEVLTEAPNSHC